MLLIFSLIFQVCAALKFHGALKSDPPELLPMPDKCVFGAFTFEIGSIWSPEVSPFGKMVCIECHCKPPVKNSTNEDLNNYEYEYEYEHSTESPEDPESYPQVDCRNIFNECPQISCQAPISSHLECCKYCPKEVEVEKIKNSGQKSISMDNKYNDEHDFAKERIYEFYEESFDSYAAILSGHGLWPRLKTSSVARCYLSFSSVTNTLYYTVSFQAMKRPSLLFFVDKYGEVLHEHNLFKDPTAHHRNKVCGKWRKLPDIVLKQLSYGLIFIKLVNEEYPQGIVMGAVRKFRALSSESFGALLSPMDSCSYGLGGFLFTSVGKHIDHLDFMVVVEGLGDHYHNKETIYVTAKFFDPYELLQYFEANATLDDSQMDYSGVWTGITKDVSHMIATGVVKVEISINKKFHLQGFVRVKNTCQSFHAMLNGQHAYKSTATGAGGSAVMSLNENGIITYSILLKGLSSQHTFFTIEENDHDSSTISIDISNTFYDEKAVGELPANMLLLQKLILNQLSINVGSKNFPESEIRGRIVMLNYDGFLSRHRGTRILMFGREVSPPRYTAASGHCWLALDDECQLHYEVFLSGFPFGDESEIVAHLQGEIGEIWNDNAPVHKKFLHDFNGNWARGIINELPKNLYNFFNSGSGYIQVNTKEYPNGEIRGRIHLPNDCMYKDTTVKQAQSLEMINDQPSSSDFRQSLYHSSFCYFQGKRYDEGASWSPDYDEACSICSCEERSVVCKPKYSCSTPQCIAPVLKAGQCCPSCPVKEDRSCVQNGRRYNVNDKWHPVLEELGVLNCVTCRCTSDVQVVCREISCPIITCTRKIRKRPHDCCDSCADYPVDSESQMQSDQGSVSRIVLSKRKCNLGHFVYEDGEKFHPIVPPFGMQYCVNCLCKTGEVKCNRISCPKQACPKSHQQKTLTQCCIECKENRRISKESPLVPIDEGLSTNPKAENMNKTNKRYFL
uniref:Chordin n=1 Tax=Hofstenia miamia TaxID=442651 RepID=A0A068CRQ4_HOFMI|nr:chordin [Hofstenia miamia]